MNLFSKRQAQGVWQLVSILLKLELFAYLIGAHKNLEILGRRIYLSERERPIFGRWLLASNVEQIDSP